MPDKKGSDDRAYARGFAAGRAAATPDPPDAESLARMFHDSYEALAPSFGYITREASAVAWENVPADNKALMISTARAVLRKLSLRPASPDERLRESLALVYVMLTGAEPMWAEMPLDERCARAANEAQQAVLAAADREAPCDHKNTPLDGGLLPRPGGRPCPDCGVPVVWSREARGWVVVPDREAPAPITDPGEVADILRSEADREAPDEETRDA